MLDFFIYSFILLMALLCFICSYQFAHQKWGALIAGYNDLTKKQKQTVDFEAISIATSKCAFAGGIYFLFIAGFLYLISNGGVYGSAAAILFSVSSFLFLAYIIRSVIKTTKFYNIEK